MNRTLFLVTFLVSCLAGFTAMAGNYQTFDIPGAIATEGRGINDHGEIVGLYFERSGD